MNIKIRYPEYVRRRIDKCLMDLEIADLNNSQLARRWNESSQLVSKFRRTPLTMSLDSALRFAEHLRTTVDWLYNGGE